MGYEKNQLGYRTKDNSWYGAMDYGVAGKDGSITKFDGWGSDALGLVGAVGNLYMTNKAINSQEDIANKQMDWSREEFYKNFAMKMAGYRQHRNDRSYENAQANYYANNGSISGFDGSKFKSDSQVYDAEGRRVGDPTMVGSNGKTYNTGNTNPIGSSFAPAPTGVAMATSSTPANQAEADVIRRRKARAPESVETGAGLSSAPAQPMPGDASAKKNKENVAKIG